MNELKKKNIFLDVFRNMKHGGVSNIYGSQRWQDDYVEIT